MSPDLRQGNHLIFVYMQVHRHFFTVYATQISAPGLQYVLIEI